MTRYVILYNGLPITGTAEQILSKLASYGSESVGQWMNKVTVVLTHVQLDTTNYDNFLAGLHDAGIVYIKERADEQNLLQQGTVTDSTQPE